jgi:light-regulated signal transduction histidine kinase (bacteriophytochrome)
VLIVLRPSDFTIVQVSENVESLLGSAPNKLLGHSISVILGDDGESELRGLVAREPLDRNPQCVLGMQPRGAVPALDITVHTINGFVCLEFEPRQFDVLGPSNPYAVIKRATTRIQTASSFRHFNEIVAEEIRALTGFDRVMIYKFHNDGHGEVFAEAKRDDLVPWLGLHYPAEDIPKPARDVFLKTWLRPVPNVAGGLAELVPLVNPDTGKSLEMTYCALRGVSIMYTEYLQNMGVKAGLTLSLRRGEKLWGLIACHHYSATRSLSVQVRQSCEFLAQIVSLQHSDAEAREDAAYQARLETVRQQLVTAALHGGLEAMTNHTPSLLDGISADGVALYTRDTWWRAGKTPDLGELDTLREWLTLRIEPDASNDALFVTENLSEVYPHGESLRHLASGILAVPLSWNSRDMAVWFRSEIVQTVNWGGNPHDKPMVLGPHGPRLTPRRSFEIFTESVRGQSWPWKQVEIESVQRLRTLLLEIEASQAKRLATLNEELLRSNEELDSFAYVASHDMKEPLRGIHKYAHQLLHSPATNENGREKLESLMRLTIRMDGLMDSLLLFSRLGRTTLVLEQVNLNEVMTEALEMVDARRSEGKTEIVVPRPLLTIACDHFRVREVFVNLLSNALKYNNKPVKRIEIGFVLPDEEASREGWPSEAMDQPTIYVKDNGIGIPSHHFDNVFKMFRRLHARDEFGGGSGAGLTIVKKLVERHNGLVWITSTIGESTTFFFTLSRGVTL